MRKNLLLYAIIAFAQLCFAPFSSAQEVKLVFLADEVPVYAEQSAASAVIQRLSASDELFGTYVDAYWYAVTLADGTAAYVLSWDVWPEQDLELIPKRITPSATTLFRMMRYFRHNDNPEKAQEFAIRIINTHNDEEYPGEGKSCFKLGHKAYMEMISEKESGVQYDAWLLGFTSHVIQEAQNETILAMAHYHQARFYAINGQTERALNSLLVIVDKYPALSSSNECEPELLETWYYRPERAKRLFCALTIIQTGDVLAKAEAELTRIAAEGSDASSAMAQELLQNIGSMPYPKDDSKWY